MKQLPSITLIAVLCSISASAETNWPQWRGPAGTGETPAVAIRNPIPRTA